MSEVKLHQLADGPQVAFRFQEGNGPVLVFLPGYMSDMAGGKATALFDWARAEGRACLLLDYSGCGLSHGTFADGTLSRWREEVLELVDAHTSGPLILIGSSMGGWLMLLVARTLVELPQPRKLAGLVGIAAAPDFTDWGYDKDQKRALAAGETVLEDNPYGPEPTPTYPAFWEDGEMQRQLTGTIPLNCPVRLLHGQDDRDVPPEISSRLADALQSDDVQVTFVKGGDHRLSCDGDIALLLRTVESLC